MDNKLKLNARCNWWNFVVCFWLKVTNVFTNMNNFALRKAMQAQGNVMNTMREMLDEDYDEDYKEDLRDVIKMGEL